MKLSISLLLLAAVGITASKLTSEKGSATGQTYKRELLDENFGQRTDVLNKYEPQQSNPGIQYRDEFKQTQQEQSAAERIFGTRVLPITKISDLLTGQGPSFDVALANHLYAPVSVYNTRQPALDESQGVTDIKKPLPNYNIFNQQVLSPEDRPKKTLSPNPNFHLPGILGPEFYTQENKQLPQIPNFVTSTQDPRYYLYQEQINRDPYIPAQYYKPQPELQKVSEDSGSDYENPEASQDNKEQRPLNNTQSTSILERQNGPFVAIQGYNSHPHGAISYASFLHNQALLDANSNSHIQNKQSSKWNQEALEEQFRRYGQLHVPQPPSKSQSQEQKLNNPPELYKHQSFIPDELPGPLNQQSLLQSGPFVPFQHQPFLQARSPFITSAGHQFISELQPKYHQFYLNPTGNPFIQAQPSLQSLKKEQPSLQSLANTEAKLESSVLTVNYSTPRDQSTPPSKPLPEESKRTEVSVQLSTQESVNGLQENTPTPAPVTNQQSVIPLHTSPTPSEPQVTITPKSQLSSDDQNLQPTTIQPETISDAPKDIKGKYFFPETSSQQVPQTTLHYLITSPTTLQSLSTLQPSAYYSPSTPQPAILSRVQHGPIETTSPHQVQIQQQDFQEIHSELLPEHQSESQKRTKNVTEYKQSSETTSQDHKLTTPQPSESPKPDYEIEIASNFDHSQLPKDLQPVKAQETNELAENQRSKDQQSHSTIEQKKTHLEQSQPHFAAIQSFGEPPSYQNINYRDPNSFFFDPSLTQAQPIIQQRFHPEFPQFVLQRQYQQPHTPAFPHVQYFGNYAESIFGGF